MGHNKTPLNEDEKRAKEKAQRMIDWFKGRDLPTGIIKLNSYTTVHDFRKAVEAHITFLYNRPLTHAFKAAYNNLYELKKYIENANKT